MELFVRDSKGVGDSGGQVTPLAAGRHPVIGSMVSLLSQQMDSLWRAINWSPSHRHHHRHCQTPSLPVQIPAASFHFACFKNKPIICENFQRERVYKNRPGMTATTAEFTSADQAKSGRKSTLWKILQIKLNFN